MGNQNDPSQDPKKFQDFGMDDNEPETNTQPKINDFTRPQVAPAPDTSAQAKVEPAAPVAPVAPQAVQAPVAAPAPAPVQQAAPAVVPTPAPAAAPQVAPASAPQVVPVQSAAPGPNTVQAQTQAARGVIANPIASSKAMVAFVGIFGALVLIFLALSFVFIAQTDKDTNPIANLLGVNDASFVNGLITFIHIVFVICSLIAFVFAMVGLFKSSMAKKDDKIARKDGLRMALIAGSILLIILMLWIFVYLYLDSKRIKPASEIQDPIITTPVVTLGLTAPIIIKFDASHVPVTSANYQIISYEWNFGDDTTGTNMVVTHEYLDKGKNDTGRFEVQLTVAKRDKKTGEETKDIYTKTVVIAKQALVSSFEATPQSGEVPLEVKLDASGSKDPDGKIVRYEWDLNEDGDFSDEEGVNITHKFEKIGKYKVALRVTSTSEDFQISEKEIIVTEAKIPLPVISVVDQPEKFLSGVAYVFKGDKSTSPNGAIDKYSWDFGDGSKLENTATVNHTFQKIGNFEVVLTTTDEKKVEGTAKMKIVIEAPQGTPKASFTTDPALTGTATTLEGKLPFTVVFDAAATVDPDNNITDYQWDFNGDGVVDNYGTKMSHTYNEEGTYNVTLTVVDGDGNKGIATTVVKVVAKGITGVLKANPIEGNAPLTVEFDASGSIYTKGQITSYQWDFGDGSAPKLGAAKMTHKYTAIGNFNPSVTVIGSDNSKDKTTIMITVRETSLSACFVSVFETGKAPLVTSFDPSCSTGTITSYLWNFGDTNSSTEVKPVHTFEKAGVYDVTLELSDSDNNTSKSKLSITVTP
jgi:PKD repeat protein